MLTTYVCALEALVRYIGSCSFQVGIGSNLYNVPEKTSRLLLDPNTEMGMAGGHEKALPSLSLSSLPYNAIRSPLRAQSHSDGNAALAHKSTSPINVPSSWRIVLTFELFYLNGV